MLKCAYEVGRKEGNLGAIFNGADEQAVEYFLDHKISFLQIEESILKAIESLEYIQNPTYEQLEQSDWKAREFVKQLWD